MRQNYIYTIILFLDPTRPPKQHENYSFLKKLHFRARFPSISQALSSMEGFYNLDRDIEGSAKSWKKFVESEYPEKEKLPQEWKNKTALQRLCVMRAMRPDRMTYAMRYGTRESGEPQGRHGTVSAMPNEQS